MSEIKERVPLQIVDGQLILTTVISCPKLRIQRQILEFVVDTGSPDSYFSDKDVRKLNIPVKGKRAKRQVDFGGSRYKEISLPKIDMFILKENKKKNEYIQLSVSISALDTTKTSTKKVQIAQELPSILGLDFLRDQKMSLHVILTEDLAYLQQEE